VYISAIEPEHRCWIITQDGLLPVLIGYEVSVIRWCKKEKKGWSVITAKRSCNLADLIGIHGDSGNLIDILI